MTDPSPHPSIQGLSYQPVEVVDERVARRSRSIGIILLCIGGLTVLWQAYGLLYWASAMIGGFASVFFPTPAEMAERSRFEWFAIALPAMIHLALLSAWMVFLRKQRTRKIVWLLAMLVPMVGLGLGFQIFIRYLSAIMP